MRSLPTSKVRPRRPRVIGAYRIPYCPELRAVEVIVPLAPRHVDFDMFFGYRPPAWDSVVGVGTAHFYLSDDGESLIGSYLGRKEEPNEREWIHSLECFLKTRNGSTRAILLLEPFGPDELYTPWGRLRFPRYTAMPERLLRLIWIDEGMPSLCDDSAFGEDL